jgi:hypothetical protein
MKRFGSLKGSARLALAVLAVLPCGLPRSARAQEPAPASATATPAEHRLSLFFSAGGAAYLSDARTIGGIGGGIGVRDTFRERFILQAELNHLVGIGSVTEVRLGAGLQRRGLYSPAALLTLSGMFGEQLRFLTPEHPTPVTGPALSLGVTVAPARFTLDKVQFSLLSLGVGVGTELPGMGLAYRVGLVEVSTSL